MKMYQIAKMTEPKFVVTSASPEAIRELLSKYIPKHELFEALIVPGAELEKYTPEDDINLLLCTPTGCEFIMDELIIDERMFV